MRVSDFGRHITFHSAEFSVSLKNGDVREEVWKRPDWSRLDNRVGLNICEAPRMVMRGRVVSDQELKARIGKLSKTERSNKLNSSEDIDGDGVKENLELYGPLSGASNMSPNINRMCRAKDFRIINNDSFRFLFVFHFAAGEDRTVHIMIESTIFLVLGELNERDRGSLPF